MFEMLYGHPPYRAQNHIQLQQLIERSGTLKFQNFAEFKNEHGETTTYNISQPCISLLKNLLKKNPMERISFEEFFSHAYLGLWETPDKNVRDQKSYSLPTRKFTTLQGTKSPNRASSYRVNANYTLESSQEINQSNAVASLSSSTTSIPPFARLSIKYGTPPSRQSGVFHSGNIKILS